jgi:hypothetical protein
MAKKRGKKKVSISLLIIGIVAGIFTAFSVMCIPCIMAAYPSIGLLFALLGALALLLARYSWAFLLLGFLLIGLGVLLQLSQRRRKCG